MVGFSFTIFLISARLFFLIDFSLVNIEEYLLEDFDGEGDLSIDPQTQVLWCLPLYVHPNKLIM